MTDQEVASSTGGEAVAPAALTVTGRAASVTGSGGGQLPYGAIRDDVDAISQGKEYSSAIDVRAIDLLDAEVAYLDNGDYEGWLGLWTAACTYWVPGLFDLTQAVDSVSLALDDRRRMEDRVYWLKSPLSSAARSMLRTAHVIGSTHQLRGGSALEPRFTRQFSMGVIYGRSHSTFHGQLVYVLAAPDNANSAYRVRRKIVRLLHPEAGVDGYPGFF